MNLRNLISILILTTAATVSGNAQTDIVGMWQTGGMSITGERNTVTGSTTPSNGNTQKYVFGADGRFSFVGYLQSTQYGCTTALFNDKQGKYAIEGSQITLIPSKNFCGKHTVAAPRRTSSETTRSNARRTTSAPKPMNTARSSSAWLTKKAKPAIAKKSDLVKKA